MCSSGQLFFLDFQYCLEREVGVVIEVKNVTQSFQKRIILEQVNLHVEKNERIALVGRNGAGKSTLIHTVLGILPLKKGTITLAGHSIKDQEWKKNVAYLPEKFHLYPHLTGLENILFFAALDHMSIADGFYQLCSSFYHSLRSNVPLLAEWFTIIKKGMNRGSQLPSCLSTYKD